MLDIHIGFDTREVTAWRVLEHSIRRHATAGARIHPLIMGELQYKGLYNRPMRMQDGRLFDEISQAPMSTEFAITRFLTPYLSGSRWAMFMDCDILATVDITRILKEIEPGKPVYCVKHKQETSGEAKMDGQVQTAYARKNWSSVMLFDCDHPANRELRPKLINSVPGRDLHAFCWLKDEDIGELALGWNWLEGYSDAGHAPINLIHYTRGGPWLLGWENVAYADLWLKEKKLMEGM